MKRMTRFRFSMPQILFLAVLLLLAAGIAAPAHAAGTVENCSNDSALNSVLTGGGDVDFNCGDTHQTATIVLNSTKTIAATTTIDGGGKITLSGGFGNRLFVVNNGVTLTLQNITLIDGYNPNSDGGAGVLNNGHLILDHVTMQTGTDSAFNGGAISTAGALDISNSTFRNNKATNGGAIYANGAGAVISINASRFEKNAATGIMQNTNGFGGAIYAKNGAQVNIEASTFYTNTGNDGGAIYNGGPTGTLNLQTSTLYENSARSKGGALLNAATASLTDVTIRDNINSGIVSGGGIFNYANLTLSRVTLSNNKAYNGAGMVNFLGTANLTDVTLSGNTATAYGGIDNYQATLNLTNVTFQNNSHGILNQNSATTHLNLKNVIISNSKGGANCDFGKAPDTSDHNLSSDATCNFGAGRDSVKIKLGPLETNGGRTLTHRLLPGSPAIDGGASVNVPKDQREVDRPQGVTFDVGAVEFVPCDGKPPKPQLWFPASGAQLTTPQVTLDWIGPDCAKSFSVVVRQGSKTGPLAFSKNNIKATQATTTALAKNKKYFWQVTACKGAQCTTSSWGKFAVK